MKNKDLAAIKNIELDLRRERIMKESRFLGTVYLFAALATLGMTGASQAGMIYYDETSFNTDVAGLTLQWQEDFGSYSNGVPNPLSIGGGQAEVSGFGFTAVLFGTKEWVGSSGGPTFIQGPSGASLGLAAISFNFGSTPGDQQVIFNLDGGGTDTSTAIAYNGSSGNLFTDGATNFVGWIGGSGEQLDDVTFSLQQQMVLDNINGYVPIPAAVWLFGSGLLGLVGIARRKKA